MLKDMVVPCGENYKIRIVGYSRSADKTFFFLPNLKIQLDVGGCDKRFEHMKYFFITHTHGDHVMYLPTVDSGTKERHKQVYVPIKAVPFVHEYVYKLWCLNDVQSRDYNNDYLKNKTFDVKGVYSKMSSDIFILKDKWKVDVLESFHTVPCVSYSFFQVRTKLKKKYLTRKSEIRELKKVGVEVTEKVIIPKFIFCGDTTIEFFEKNKGYLEKHSFPLIIVECTFLYDKDEKNSKKRGHIHWSHIKPVVQKYKKTLFILIHFSLKYTDKEIKSFFNDVKEKDGIGNVMPWVN